MRNTSYERTIVYRELDKVYPCLSIFRNALFLHLVRHKTHLKLNFGFGTFFSYAILYLQVQLLNHVLTEGAAVVLRSEVSHGPRLVRRNPTGISTNPALSCVHRGNLSRNTHHNFLSRTQDHQHSPCQSYSYHHQGRNGVVDCSSCPGLFPGDPRSTFHILLQKILCYFCISCI